jgi:hypothetical protein
MNMNILSCETKDLLEMLRFCAHRLLLAYDETLQNELWEASEKAAEACQSLLPLIQMEQKFISTFH